MLFKNVSHDRQKEAAEPFQIQGDSQDMCDPELDPLGYVCVCVGGGGTCCYKVHYGDKRQNWNGAYRLKYCINFIFPEFNNCTVAI